MADEISFRFGADISDLEPAIRQVSDGFGKVKTSADQMSQALKQAGSSLGSVDPMMMGMATNASKANAGMLGMASSASRASASIAAVSQASVSANPGMLGIATGAEQASQKTEHLSFATAGARRELIVLAHEMAMGNYSRFGGSMMVLAERMGGVSMSVMGAAGAIAALALTLYELVNHIAEANQQLDAIRGTMAAMGNAANFSRSGVKAFVQDLDDGFHIGKTAVREMYNETQKLPEATEQSRRKIVELGTAWSTFKNGDMADGDKAKETVQSITKAVEGGVTGVTKLAEKWNLLDFDMADALDHAKRNNSTFEATDALLAKLTERMNGYGEAYRRATKGSGTEEMGSPDYDPNMKAPKAEAFQKPGPGKQEQEALDSQKVLVARTEETIQELRNKWDGSKADLAQAEAQKWQAVLAAQQAGGRVLVETQRELEVKIAAAQKAAREARSSEAVQEAHSQAQVEAAASTSGRAGALKATIAVDKELLASGKLTAEARKSAEQEEALAVAQLSAEERSNTLANLRQKTQEARQGSSERIAAAQAELTFVEGLYSKDTSEYRQALNSKLQAKKEFEKEQQAIQHEETNTTLALSRIDLQAQREALDAQVQAGQITAEQKIEQLRKVAEEEYRLDLEALESERTAAEKTPLIWEQAQDKILIRSKQFNAELDKLADQQAAAQKKAADQTANVWERALSPIERAFDTSITGMIMGTQTLKQAVAHMAQSMLAEEIGADLKYLAHRGMVNAGIMSSDKLANDSGILSLMFTEQKKTAVTTAGQGQRTAATTAGNATRTASDTASEQGFFGRMTSQIGAWLGFETAKTGATTVGETTRTGVATTGATERGTVEGAETTKSVGLSAARGGAATYSDACEHIPYGWLIGAGLAAASFAAIMAFSSFGGEGEVPFDGALYQLHAKETVLPADIAVPLRSALKGPGLSIGLPSGINTAANSNLPALAGAGGGDTHHNYYGSHTTEIHQHGTNYTPDQIRDITADGYRLGHEKLIKNSRKALG